LAADAEIKGEVSMFPIDCSGEPGRYFMLINGIPLVASFVGRLECYGCIKPTQVCTITLLVLTDFVVGEIVKKRSGMEVRKSATLWSDEQHRGKEASPIPWDEAYLRAVYE
jgi:hypothetical protein